MTIIKPAPRENFYFSQYIEKATNDDLIPSLQDASTVVHAVMDSLSEEQGNYAYAAGKWSIKQVLAHCIDTERIMAYRALCISRKETTALPGYDHNNYVLEDLSPELSISELLDEYDAVRSATKSLFKRMKVENVDFVGNANGLTISARELGWLIPGHELHHMEVIKEKYL